MLPGGRLPPMVAPVPVLPSPRGDYRAGEIPCSSCDLAPGVVKIVPDQRRDDKCFLSSGHPPSGACLGRKVVSAAVSDLTENGDCLNGRQNRGLGDAAG